ncbi:MAG TPA: type III pantothenate kinase [Sedimentisphaerales bacterium]|nr:type III pantothenate kinase [Sedimentisphaerales bacterium]HNU28606.1 type III pantothenate kinase [Sedimentisphaerales bacterium]
MNVIAVDIGNTNIGVGLFLDGKEDFIRSIAGRSEEDLRECLIGAWAKIPVLESSRERKRNGVIVASSVKPAWTDLVRRIASEDLGEKIRVIGEDVPLPISTWVDEPKKVGTDRIVAAAAAYDVVEDAVVVADFGTAVTIDLVDEHGVFLGGVICPGFEISSQALKDNTAQLPKVTVHRPDGPFGKNTADAINCGLYYSIIGGMEEIIRRYAEQIGRWPQTIITGSAAETIKDDCPFVDNYVPHLVVKGIVLAYMKYIEEKSEMV